MKDLLNYTETSLQFRILLRLCSKVLRVYVVGKSVAWLTTHQNAKQVSRDALVSFNFVHQEKLGKNSYAQHYIIHMHILFL